GCLLLLKSSQGKIGMNRYPFSIERKHPSPFQGLLSFSIFHKASLVTASASLSESDLPPEDLPFLSFPSSPDLPGSRTPSLFRFGRLPRNPGWLPAFDRLRIPVLRRPPVRSEALWLWHT